MVVRRALVTGIAGQDGTYLAQLLLAKGYVVHGIVRRRLVAADSVLAHLLRDQKTSSSRLHVHVGDIRHQSWLGQLFEDIRPHETYNLAAQSSVAKSFTEPDHTQEVNYTAVGSLLEAVSQFAPETRLYQASSSEMFGLTQPPQNETSAFLPQSPYGVAKAGAYVLVREARENNGLFAVNGIAFNHESPRRSTSFVSRKISHGVAAIIRGDAELLELGNLEAVRDWGYAPEFVDGMWRSLQHDDPQDYILASGEGHSVRDFVQNAFDVAGLDWQTHVRHNEEFDRAHDVQATVGNATKAKEILGWRAETTLRELASIMVEADMQRSASQGVFIDTPTISAWR